MGTRARRRVRVINLVRIFQSLNGFTALAFDLIYQTHEKIAKGIALHQTVQRITPRAKLKPIFIAGA